jgi:hypothetical protein
MELDKTVKQTNRSFGAVGVKGRVEMSADECKALCESAGKEYLSGYENRVMRYVITSETQDRYGDIVRVAGIKLDNYRKNPQFLYAHQHGDLPIGCALRVNTEEVAKTMIAQAMFLDDRVDTSGKSDIVYKFAASGFMPGCSIGFMPLKINRPTSPEERNKLGLGEYGVEFLESELLEFSACPIQANPDALTASFKSIDLKSSMVTKQDLVAAEKAAMFDGEYLSAVERAIDGDKPVVFDMAAFTNELEKLKKISSDTLNAVQQVLEAVNAVTAASESIQKAAQVNVEERAKEISVYRQFEVPGF